MKLYKYFENKEHALDLVNGTIFMRTMEYYRNTEDLTRGDRNEGYREFNAEKLEIETENGWLPIGGLVNPIKASVRTATMYIFCMTDSVELSKFGRFRVTINKPERLAALIRRSLCMKFAHALERFACGKVKYVAHQFMDDDLAFTKLNIFSEEKEHRLLIDIDFSKKEFGLSDTKDLWRRPIKITNQQFSSFMTLDEV